MKKFILGTVAVAVLSTNLIANWDWVKTTSKKEFCSYAANSNYYSSLITFDEGFCSKNGNTYVISSQSTFNVMNEVYEQKVGKITRAYLNEKGIKTNLDKSWGTLAIAYNKFLCTVNKKEKEELIKFLMYTSSNSKLANSNRRHSVYDTIHVIKKLVSSFNDRAFLDLIINENNSTNQKIYSKFVNYIIRKEFKEAVKYIRAENEKQGYTKYFKEISELCKNKDITTVADMILKYSK